MKGQCRIQKKPDSIISSGAAVAVPFFYLGKAMANDN